MMSYIIKKLETKKTQQPWHFFEMFLFNNFEKQLSSLARPSSTLMQIGFSYGSLKR